MKLCEGAQKLSLPRVVHNFLPPWMKGFIQKVIMFTSFSLFRQIKVNPNETTAATMMALFIIFLAFIVKTGNRRNKRVWKRVSCKEGSLLVGFYMVTD